MARFNSYFICTSPRSGSTHLCKLLSATSVAGTPESYFHTPSVKRWAEYFELKTELPIKETEVLRSIFTAAITKGSLASGIFGLRIQRSSFNYFIQQLTKLHPERSNDSQRIVATFGSVCYIHLTRTNKIEQAISLLKAQQTGLWHIAPDGSELERLSAAHAPEYNRLAISERISELTSYEDGWLEWFSREKIVPLRIEYQELSDEPFLTLARVLDHLGVNAEAAYMVEPKVAKMADRTNMEWATRFRSESQSK